MNQPGLRRSTRTGRGIVFCGFLLVFVFSCRGIGADEKYGMPSEAEAYRLGTTNANATAEDIVRVESLMQQEDMVFVNHEPFALGRRTRFEDERGARIDLKDIPVGAQIEVRYHMGSRLEDSGYGPKDKVLTRIRIVEPPPRRKHLP